MESNNDQQHVSLLATFHYVLGGITAFFACFPIIHVVMGIAMMAGAFDQKNGPPPWFGLIFVVMGGLFFVLGWALAVLLFLAGGRMRRRQRYMFCFVTACISCAFMPLGTILGIFTIIVLSRPSVKAMFLPTPPIPPTPASGA